MLGAGVGNSTLMEGNKGAKWRHERTTTAIYFYWQELVTKLPPSPRARSVKKYAIIAPAYAYWLFPPFHLEPIVHKNNNNNFVPLSHVLQMFLRSLVCFGTEFQICSKENKWKNKNLCRTWNQVAKLFIMRKFLTTACTALTFHLYHPAPLLTEMHWTLWSITNTEYLCLGKLKVGKLERKFRFYQRYLY
jgi:hypothetical protein